MNPAKYPVKYLILLLTISLSVFNIMAADNIAVGHWRHHLPNHNVIKLEEADKSIISATPYSLIIFNKNDNSIERINKVHGLSDFDISTMAYANEHNAIIVGYQNGNLDIIINNGFLNITDILEANIIGSKRVNSITVNHDRALLACDFGIVSLSLSDWLIYDTWYIGPFGSMVNVYDIIVADNHIYAATNAGLLTANTEVANLADYRNWERIEVSGASDEVINKLALHGDRIIVNKHDQDGYDEIFVWDAGVWQPFSLPGNTLIETTRSLRTSHGYLIISNDYEINIIDSEMEHVQKIFSYSPGAVRANDVIFDKSGKLWAGDREFGLVRQHDANSFEKIILPGPPHANSFGLATGGGRLWVAPGAVAYNGANSWNRNGIFMLDQGKWSIFNRYQFDELADVADVISIIVDPANHDKAFAASWFGGMIALSPEGVVTLYNEENSTLRKRTEHNDWLRVGGVAVDRRGNVWVTNSEVDRPLSVKKPDGTWMSFTSGGAFGTQTRVRDIIIDNSDQKWVNLPGNGIFVFRENTLDNTNNFDTRRLTTQANHGSLPSNSVHSMAVDHNGYVWIGTEEGVAVFYSPQQALSGDPFNAQRIVVEQDDGFAGYLLETEIVNCITVDGSNKKWFGTSRSGAFLISADGRETEFHFNKENSPLPSNNILDIAINGQTGEVYFATDRGLVSYRGFATEATSRHANVYAYPNPVRPGYAGYISVKGLVRNASVKITDINGNLVWETIAEGGQAVWNGQDLFGRRPSSGVYLVFSTNDDGEETIVTKIMFIN